MVVKIIHLQYAVGRAIGNHTVLNILDGLQTIVAVNSNVGTVDIQCTVDLCIITFDQQRTSVTINIALLGEVL